MEYILLAILLLLFLLSYFSCGRDFFAPTTMMIISFILACMFSIYVSQDVGYHISAKTMWVIVSFLFAGVVTGFLCRCLVACFQIREIKEICTPLPVGFSVFCIGFSLFTGVLYLRFIRRVGGSFGSFSQIMSSFRDANAYSTNKAAQTPLYLKQMLNMLYAMFILHSFDLIRHFHVLPGSTKRWHIIVMGLTVAVSFLTGGRFTALMSIVACVALFHFIRIQKLGKYKTYGMAFLLKMFAVALLSAVLFYLVKELVGRVSSDSFLDYIAHYFGTSMINFDLFLQNPPSGSNIWGKESFYALINILRRIGLLDIEPYLFHREFRVLHGYSMGNVYTMFRGLIYDFGYAGAMVGYILYCILTSVTYEVIKKKKSTKWILIYASMYFCFPMASYNDFFFSQVVSAGFLIKIFMIILLYEIFSRKKIRIVVRKP